jgi:CubicO group peptidase (beta-lactamase class C family)
MGSRTFRFLMIGFFLLLIFAGLTYLTYRDNIARLQRVITLFDEPVIADNFRSMDTILEFSTVQPGDDVWELTENKVSLPETFQFGDETMNMKEYMADVRTLCMIVLHDDNIVYEEYFEGSDATTKHISWSVAKSFTSALVGIAVDEGHIDDIMDPVTKYVPALSESGYNDVPIKHILQMSSGIKFNEDYADFNSDINRMGRTLALNTPIDEFIMTLENEIEPGTVNRYVSMDTQVLGMLLTEATGQSVTSYLEEKIWKPMGAEASAYWSVDSNQLELTFGFLNAVLRDYARFGLLYMHNGRRGDNQIVPETWIASSVVPDAPHLIPGTDRTDAEGMGYGYQWWIPVDSDGEFLAIGVYNQMIYINTKKNVVIAKNSANHHYLEGNYLSEPIHIEMFRAIAEEVSKEDD